MGELVKMAADIQKKEASAAWRHYLTLLEKQTGSAKEAEELLAAGRAVGRSAKEIEADQAWLSAYRAQQKLIDNGSGLRDQEIALEQQIQKMEEDIQAAIVELRKPQREAREKLRLLTNRSGAVVWAQNALRDLMERRHDLAVLLDEFKTP